MHFFEYVKKDRRREGGGERGARRTLKNNEGAMPYE
jgi:hypothetical protein